MKTFMAISGRRVVLRTRELIRCSDCGMEYHPRVHAYPGLVILLGLVAIIGVVAAGVLWYTGRVERWWVLGTKIAAALIVAILAYLASLLHKGLIAPRFYRPGSGGEPPYGAIILECPHCGSTSADLVA